MAVAAELKIMLPEADLLVCGICTQPLTDDIQELSCGHQFCGKCLAVHVAYTVQYSKFPCYVCGAEHDAEKARIGEQWKKIEARKSTNFDASATEVPTKKSRVCAEAGHNGLEMQLYCSGHHKMICGMCLIASHKECDVTGIHDETARRKEAIADLSENLKAYRINVLEAQKENKNLFQQVRKQITEMESKIKPQFKDQMEKMDRLSEKMEVLQREDDLGALITGEKEVQVIYNEILRGKLQTLKWTCSLEDGKKNMRDLTRTPKDKTWEVSMKEEVGVKALHTAAPSKNTKVMVKTKPAPETSIKDQVDLPIPIVDLVKKDTPVIPGKQMELKYQYREGQWSPLNQEGKKQYDRRFLLQFQFSKECMKKPAGLPNLPDVILETALQRKDRSQEQYNAQNTNALPHFMPGYIKPSPSGGKNRSVPRRSDNAMTTEHTHEEAKNEIEQKLMIMRTAEQIKKTIGRWDQGCSGRVGEI